MNSAWRINRSFLFGLAGVMIIMASMSCMAGDRGRPPENPFSIDALTRFCGLPLPCDRKVPCDGAIVSVWGYVDPANVYDARRYPRLPYEKFKLEDRLGNSVEIWPQSADNRPIFDWLARRHPGAKVIVTGRIQAVELPSNAACYTGVKVLIDDVSQLAYGQP